MGHEVSVVKMKAAEAHTEFFRKYYANMDNQDRNIVINRYLDNLQSCNQLVRIGFAQAIGNVKTFLKILLWKILYDVFHSIRKVRSITSIMTFNIIWYLFYSLINDYSFVGYFPLFIICERVKDIIEALIKCTEISESSLKWAESRKEAIHALIMVCQTLGVKEAGLLFLKLEFRIIN